MWRYGFKIQEERSNFGRKTRVKIATNTTPEDFSIVMNHSTVYDKTLL